MALRNRFLTTLLTLTTAATVAPGLACPPNGDGGGFCPPTVPYHSAPQVVYPPPRVVHTGTVRGTAQAVSSQARATVNQAKVAADQTTAAARLRATAAQAKAAFTAKNYGTALSLIDQIVKVAPQNNEALQFRSLIRFAMADYKPAAADAYEAIKHGPLWNRKSLESLYGDMAGHERHLKDLRATAEEQPEALDVHFLLAYQMLMTGDLAAGERELETVLSIKPGEPLATNLLKVVKDLREKESTVAAETR